ncbi:solute carrier family 19 member 3b [Alosa sapidissima]|uniref:solute carrier family 19 member 3b n=1 Tax=Alosa sapidissima TaxID=34773 RepID=UPI001C0A05F5|nr:solute carrier family 19 member 3b [Alosa sapidissima]
MNLQQKIRSWGWIYPTAILCLYGFFANCRPAEPFLTPYLVGPKNISEEVVTNYLFPIWTYSYLALLFPVFLLTDFLRYKPLIMLQGAALVSNYCLLCFSDSLAAMTALQVNYAVVTSTEVAYFSSIYCLVPPERYQQATGYLRAAMLIGYTFGATLSQLLVSLVGTSLFHINAITLGTVSVSLLVSLAIPIPRRGMFFKGAEAGEEAEEQASGSEVEKGGCCQGSLVAGVGVVSQMWAALREGYGSGRVVCWSLWWALATSGYTQVFNYVQLMWDHVEPSSTAAIYNGGVEAVCTLVGAAAAFGVGHVRVSWSRWGELCLGAFSAVGAGAVFLMAFSSSIWLCYAGYVLFKASYMLLITITTFQIAANLSMECYALTFGINTFVALVLQTVITAIIVDESALGLDIVTQFIVYGSYYTAISTVFFIRGLYTACRHHCRPTHPTPHKEVLSSQRL